MRAEDNHSSVTLSLAVCAPTRHVVCPVPWQDPTICSGLSHSDMVCHNLVKINDFKIHFWLYYIKNMNI